MIRIANVSLPITAEERAATAAAASALGVKSSEILSCKIARRAIDARDKSNIRYVMSLDVTGSWSDTREALIASNAKQATVIQPKPSKPSRSAFTSSGVRYNTRPVVVGFGPAGMFAALTLAEAGLNPIVLERGKDCDARAKDIAKFVDTRTLDTESNIQFGEGGAGTFSDGKLTTGIKDKRKDDVLRTLVTHGAPPDILIDAKPHIGTDNLPRVVMSIRRRVIELGGEVLFGAKFDGFKADKRMVILTAHMNGEWLELETENLILAAGHSARDTLRTLAGSGVRMSAKPFAVGVRIEHSQAWLNRAQYGGFHKMLGAADYKLSTHLPSGIGVFTFCMCPGGHVVAATSERGGVVVNGMSNYARDGANSNAGLLVSVEAERFNGDTFGGMDFQERLETDAFKLGGGDYSAPAQLVRDFMVKRASKRGGAINPMYPIGVIWCSLDECLPTFICDSIRAGLVRFDRMLPGFASGDAVLTAVETRSSCPVRIERDDRRETSVKGVYVAGEGGGWAGGIVSSAVDGIRTAEVILGC